MLKKIPFTKMQGTGNDFIILRNYNLKKLGIEITKDFVQKICNRHFGIGSDGLLIITQGTNKKYKYIMYKPDGSREQMSGNGIRCYMKYLKEKGFIDNNNLEVETDNGFLNLQYENGSVRVDMGKPTLIKDLKYKTTKLGDVFLVKSEDKTFKFMPISMGNPHAVIYLYKNKLENFDIKKYGVPIKNNTEIFNSKVNIEFVEVISPLEINMRVYSRGSGETLACGTGSCAAIIAGILLGELEKNEYIKLNLKGGILWVKWDGNPNSPVILKGGAEILFDGEYII